MSNTSPKQDINSNYILEILLNTYRPGEPPLRTSSGTLFRPFPRCRGLWPTIGQSIDPPRAEQQASGTPTVLPFNTDYTDVSLKASHCAACIVILSILFPLSAATWRAPASLFQSFTPEALITGGFYHFFTRTLLVPSEFCVVSFIMVCVCCPKGSWGNRRLVIISTNKSAAWWWSWIFCL